ncbi:MAG: hypothetical protein KAQ97_05035, partial [Candidatus Fermentibacteraceae bacterium]|nr:hypothetical protein [Candidatus Fermentibacteraceae bacterium]
NPAYLVLSVLLVILGHLVNLIIWILLSFSFGMRIPITSAGRAWFLSRLGRYVPGKVTFLLYRIRVYKQFPGRVVALATVVEYIASISAACLIILASIIENPIAIPDLLRWTAAAGAVLFLSVLWPPILNRVVNLILRVFRRKPVEEIPSYRVILSTVGGYIVAALIHGLGFFLLLRSLTDISMSYYLTITGVYFAAGLVGLAALFAPRGIGVLEGFLLLVLPLFIPRPVAIVGILGIRIIVTVTELFLTGCFVVVFGLRKRKTRTER